MIMVNDNDNFHSYKRHITNHGDTNKQQRKNLRMPVESYKKLIWLINNVKTIKILILQI